LDASESVANAGNGAGRHVFHESHGGRRSSGDDLVRHNFEVHSAQFDEDAVEEADHLHGQLVLSQIGADLNSHFEGGC